VLQVRLQHVRGAERCKARAARAESRPTQSVRYLPRVVALKRGSVTPAPGRGDSRAQSLLHLLWHPEVGGLPHGPRKALVLLSEREAVGAAAEVPLHVGAHLGGQRSFDVHVEQVHRLIAGQVAHLIVLGCRSTRHVTPSRSTRAGIRKDDGFVACPSLLRTCSRAPHVSARAFIATLALSVSLQGAAQADTQEPAAPVSAASHKRPVPNYDGRPPAPTPLKEDLLWVPRLVLSPLYLVSEFAIRRPLSVAIPAAEKIDLFTKIYDFFTFGPDHKIGIFPIALAEFDFKPSVGFFAFWSDAGFSGDDLSLHAEAWPDDWFGASVKQRVKVDERHTVELEVSEMHRPDRVFYGVGPNSLESSESRYALQEIDGSVAYEWRSWRSSRIETMLGARDVYVTNGAYVGDPSLTAEAATGAFSVPFGFGREYTAEYNRVVAAVDTRVQESRRGSGVRLELDGEQGSDLRNAPASSWVRYGATVGAYVDLTGYRRVLGATVTTQLADPLRGADVPFTELVSLGGDHPMRGFYTGRLVGRSAAVATASYTWPIGPWIDGDLQLALGNVFGEHLEDLSARLLRFSGALGVSVGGLQKTAVMGSQDAPLEFLIGVGSETFAHGGQIDSLRVTAGVPLSF